MKIKKARKKYLIVGIALSVLIIISASIVFKAEITRFWYEFQLGNRCENEADFNSKNIGGQIQVYFNGNPSEHERINIIKSYGLVYLGDYIDNIGLVSVPVGKERKWICILSENKTGIDKAATVGVMVPW